MEFYHCWIKKYDVSKANRLYVLHTIKFLRPYALKSILPLSIINANLMLRHNLKIAWRNLEKQKMYSAIKIGGFSLGIAACFLITLFIRDELSYDKHYADGDRIYRIVGAYDLPGNSLKGVSSPAPIKQTLDNDFPEIEKAGRLIIFDWFESGNNQFRPEDKTQNTYEEGFIYADPEMLEILEIPMVHGERSTALSQPNSIVISRRKAEKYFPDENPIGQIVILNEDESNPYKIGGVMENFPSNSHLQYDFLITLSDKEFWPGSQLDWLVNVYDSYVKLKPGSDPHDLEKKLLSIRDHIVMSMEKNDDPEAETMKKYLSFELQSIDNIYLHSDDIRDTLRHGDMKVVWLFGAIAAFILLLACINFINLSTAKSANRAKEVGLRKVVGSYRGNLIGQFLTESLVFSFISFAIGLSLASILLPYFNLLSDKSLIFPLSEWWLFPVLITSIIVIGILAGFYPALYLSVFKPINVLKGRLSRGSRNSNIRGGLVVFQFTTSIVLIICTFITYQQMQFILNKKIGFDKEQVLMIQGTNTLGQRRLAFKNELLRLSAVKNVSQSDFLPVTGTLRDHRQFWREGRKQLGEAVGAQFWRTDQDYISTLGMKLVDGRDFSDEIASDSSAAIINQTMARQLGLEHPVGERISMNWGSWNVVGVVEDFHFESMKGTITPLCLIFAQYDAAIILVKVETENMARVLESVSGVWKKFMPNQPIRYTFLDDSYARMYADVSRTGKVFTIFAALAIIVACLGLFALSAFMMEQRSKEISVRKVMGASPGGIFYLLTINFLKLVLVALALAIPVGWYLMKEWLKDYTYSIDITWEIFAISGAIALLIALFTISSESIKAILANPINSLKSE